MLESTSTRRVTHNEFAAHIGCIGVLEYWGVGVPNDVWVGIGISIAIVFFLQINIGIAIVIIFLESNQPL